MKKLKLGIPKGSLQDSTAKWFRKAGYNITIGERSYYSTIDDEEIEVVIARPQESDWWAVDTVTDEAIVRDLIPELKRAGARDIVEYPLDKVIPQSGMYDHV
jgi:ATP phosphoribosyltransferase